MCAWAEPGSRSSDIQRPGEPCGDLWIQRIELVRAPGLGKRLVQSSVRRQAVRVEIVGIGNAGIQLYGPPQFALRRRRVPVVDAQLIAERCMGVGEGGVERERLE